MLPNDAPPTPIVNSCSVWPGKTVVCTFTAAIRRCVAVPQGKLTYWPLLYCVWVVTCEHGGTRSSWCWNLELNTTDGRTQQVMRHLWKDVSGRDPSSSVWKKVPIWNNINLKEDPDLKHYLSEEGPWPETLSVRRITTWDIFSLKMSPDPKHYPSEEGTRPATPANHFLPRMLPALLSFSSTLFFEHEEKGIGHCSHWEGWVLSHVQSCAKLVPQSSNLFDSKHSLSNEHRDATNISFCTAFSWRPLPSHFCKSTIGLSLPVALTASLLCPLPHHMPISFPLPWTPSRDIFFWLQVWNQTSIDFHQCVPSPCWSTA